MLIGMVCDNADKCISHDASSGSNADIHGGDAAERFSTGVSG